MSCILLIIVVRGVDFKELMLMTLTITQKAFVFNSL